MRNFSHMCHSPPIAFDVETTMLQPLLVIDGGGMSNLANVCDDCTKKSDLEIEKRANNVRDY